VWAGNVHLPGKAKQLAPARVQYNDVDNLPADQLPLNFTDRYLTEFIQNSPLSRGSGLLDGYTDRQATRFDYHLDLPWAVADDGTGKLGTTRLAAYHTRP